MKGNLGIWIFGVVCLTRLVKGDDIVATCTVVGSVACQVTNGALTRMCCNYNADGAKVTECCVNKKCSQGFTEAGCKKCHEIPSDKLATKCTAEFYGRVPSGATGLAKCCKLNDNNKVIDAYCCLIVPKKATCISSDYTMNNCNQPCA